VTDLVVSVRTADKHWEALWSAPSSWEEYEGFLRLGARDMPAAYFPIDQLKNAGVYATVVGLARSNVHGAATTDA
jgi:hypothetical protein